MKQAGGSDSRTRELREDLIEQHLTQVGRAFSKTDDLVWKADALEAHYVRTTKANRLLDCARCGRRSNRTAKTCPFCGEEGITVEHVDERKEPRRTEIALPPPAPLEPAPGTVDDLDRGVRRVAALQEKGMENYFDLAEEIHDIYARKLWMQRRDERGKQAYANWSQFCAHEFDGISVSHSYRMMDVAEKFAGRKTVAIELGIKKATRLLRLPNGYGELDLGKAAEERKTFESMVEKAKTMSCSELEREIAPLVKDRPKRQTMRQDKGGRGRSPGTRQRPEAAESKAARPEPSGVTVVMSASTVVIPLYCKGEKVESRSAKRAKRLADLPFGVETFANGVERRYALVQRPDKSMQLKIVTERPPE